MSGHTPFLNHDQPEWYDSGESIFGDALPASSDEGSSNLNANYSPNQSSSDSISPGLLQSHVSPTASAFAQINPYTPLPQSQSQSQPQMHYQPDSLHSFDYDEGSSMLPPYSFHPHSFISSLTNTAPPSTTFHNNPRVQSTTPSLNSPFYAPSPAVSIHETIAYPHSSHLSNTTSPVTNSQIAGSGVNKKEERKLRNRLSAQKSRQKKEDLLMDYKAKSEQLERVNLRLQQENDELRAENRYLKDELQKTRRESTLDSSRTEEQHHHSQQQQNYHAMPSAVPSHSLQETRPTITAVAPRIPSYSIASLMMGLNRGALLMIVLSVGVMVTLVTSPYGPTVDPSQMSAMSLERSSHGFRSRQILTIEKNIMSAFIKDASLPGFSEEGKHAKIECDAPIKAEDYIEAIPVAVADGDDQNNHADDSHRALFDSIAHIEVKEAAILGKNTNSKENAEENNASSLSRDEEISKQHGDENNQSKINSDKIEDDEDAEHEIVRHKKMLYSHRRMTLHENNDIAN